MDDLDAVMSVDAVDTAAALELHCSRSGQLQGLPRDLAGDGSPEGGIGPRPAHGYGTRPLLPAPDSTHPWVACKPGPYWKCLKRVPQEEEGQDGRQRGGTYASAGQEDAEA